MPAPSPAAASALEQLIEALGEPPIRAQFAGRLLALETLRASPGGSE